MTNRERARRWAMAALLPAVLLFGVGWSPSVAPAAGVAAPAAASLSREAMPVVQLQASPRDAGEPGAQAAVRRTYEALANSDRTAYLNSIAPAVRDKAIPGARLTFGTQWLLGSGSTAVVPDITLQSMQYTVTHLGDTWARVRVEGTGRTGDFPEDRTIELIEVAHQVDGMWHTSLPAVYAESAAGRAFARSSDGTSYADAAADKAVRGRESVKITEVAPSQSGEGETWWPITIENGDVQPHTISVQLRNLNAVDGRELLDYPAELTAEIRAALQQRFHVAPLTETVVKLAVPDELLASILSGHASNTTEQIEPIIFMIDDLSPNTAEEMASMITISATNMDQPPQLKTYDGVTYLDSLNCLITIHNADEVGHALRDLQLSYTTVTRQPERLLVRHSTQQLEDLLVEGGRSKAPVTSIGPVGSKLVKADDLLHVKAAALDFTIVDRHRSVEEKLFVPGCSVTIHTP